MGARVKPGGGATPPAPLMPEKSEAGVSAPARKHGGEVAGAADERGNAEYAFWCPACGHMEFPLTREEAEKMKQEHDLSCFSLQG